MTEPSIAVATNGRWVAIPIDGGETPTEYGPAVVAELGKAVPADSREPLAEDLTLFAGHAHDSGAIFAAVMLAEGAVLAYTECRPFDVKAADLPADPEQLAGAIDAATIDPPGWRRVSTADLPAGPAVRVHVLDAGSPARSRSSGRQPSSGRARERAGHHSVKPGAASVSSPSKARAAAASVAWGSFHGGMCVRTSRPTPAAVAHSPASRPDMCRLGGYGEVSTALASHSSTSAPRASSTKESETPVSPEYTSDRPPASTRMANASIQSGS